MFRKGRVILFVPENIQANRPVGVDVWVINLGREGDLRRLERVVRGEVNCEEEDSALVWTVRGPHDGGLQRTKIDKKCQKHQGSWVYIFLS